MLLSIWKWAIAPWVYGVVSIPMTAIVSIAKPLQPACVLVATALYWLYEPIAWGFVGLIAVFGMLDMVVPQTRPPYKSFGDHLAFLTLTVGWLGGFLLAFTYLPSFNGVLRWLSAATIGYYVGTVSMCYGELFATGGQSEFERLVKRWDGDVRQQQEARRRGPRGERRGAVMISRLFGGKKLTADERPHALDYYQKSLRLLALQDHEADLYNRALMVHMNSLENAGASTAMVDASRRLSLAGKECIKRHASLAVPEIDVVAADYLQWHGLYLAWSEWADAQHDVYLAIAQGGRAVDSRVRDLFAASGEAHKRAEAQTKKLLQAIGLTASDAKLIVAATQDEPAWEPSAQ